MVISHERELGALRERTAHIDANVQRIGVEVREQFKHMESMLDQRIGSLRAEMKTVADQQTKTMSDGINAAKADIAGLKGPIMRMLWGVVTVMLMWMAGTFLTSGASNAQRVTQTAIEQIPAALAGP